MLLTLSISSIALIEKVSLDFSHGMTVFTGETGAGKSILLDAIGLVLGQRGDSTLIRRGEMSAFVEALFHVGAAESLVVALLDEWGFEVDDGEVLLSRELHKNGRTVCRINGKIATVQMLRELGSLLVDQHGQHESFGLGRPEEQLRLLDLYGRHEEALTEYKAAYGRFRQAQERFAKAHVDEQERARRMDTLMFQIQEIESAHLKPEEEELLREERKKLQNADKIRNYVETATRCLHGGDGVEGAVDLLSEALRNLQDASEFDDDLDSTVQLLETARVYAEEASIAVSKHVDLLDVDPLRLEEVSNRLAEVRSLLRKYGLTVEEVLTHLERARTEYNDLETIELVLSKLEKDAALAEGELRAKGRILHDLRTGVASRLSLQVESIVRTLNIPSARFVVSVEPRVQEDGSPDFTGTGSDFVQFLFSANKGEELRPLGKVASGGELSRLLLAIKSVLAEVDDVQTMIFDEIDAGVSGQAVERLAHQLASLADSRQVLCVTHSPQVAAVATEHFAISKSEDTDATRTQVSKLDDLGRSAEIARLIGGGVSDETARAHANALLSKSTTAASS